MIRVIVANYTKVIKISPIVIYNECNHFKAKLARLVTRRRAKRGVKKRRNGHMIKRCFN